jgi:hypothetical protein
MVQDIRPFKVTLEQVQNAMKQRTVGSGTASGSQSSAKSQRDVSEDTGVYSFKWNLISASRCQPWLSYNLNYREKLKNGVGEVKAWQY